jgi:hypothetical protein
MGHLASPVARDQPLQRIHTSGTLEPYSDARPSVPIPGAPSITGTIMTFGAREIPGQKRMYRTVGDSTSRSWNFPKTRKPARS